MKVELSKTQQEALAREKNLAVTASAGTGKTLVLVRRYLDILLKENVRIHNILAITFTNKAAAEMIERIAEELDQKLKSDLPEPEISHIAEIRNGLSAAYISTIHAFCTRLLREFPLHMGMDPDFTVLNEMQVEIVLETAYKQVIESLETETDSWTTVFRILGTQNIKKMLKKAASFRYELQSIISKQPESDPKEIQKEYQQWYIRYITEHITDRNLQSLITEAQQISRDGFILNESESVKTVYNTVTDFIGITDKKSFRFCVALTRLVHVFTKSDGTAYTTLSKLGGKNSWADPDVLLRLSKKCAQIFPILLNIPHEQPSDFTRAISQFYDLYKRFLHKYDELKTEQGAVDFDDLQLLTLRLLEDPSVREQVRRQFRFIMVDEFQDTNRLQWDIIRLIWENTSNNLFVVGDPKQSIYGFRNADVRVFKNLQNEFTLQHAAAIIHLDESFRFKIELTLFLNRIFGKILTETDEWSVGYQNLITGRKDAKGGYVECALFPDDSQQDAQASYICEKIGELIKEEDYTYGDVAVLLRTRNHLSEIEETFRSYQLPFQTVGGIGFYQRQEIYDIYHLIRFLINPHDDIALVGLLRSPFVHLSDEALFYLAINSTGSSYWECIQNTATIKSLPESENMKLNRFRAEAEYWHERRDRVGFYELLEEIFYRSSYAAIMAGTWQGDRLLANIRKVADLAIQYESSGFLSLTDFAEFLHTLINREAQEGEAELEFQLNDAVTIMTVHQAKGLQFPVVFFPHLEQKIRRGGDEGIYIDGEYGIAVKPFSGEMHFLLDLLKKRKFEKDIAELKRILYVACTRAADQLYLSGMIKENNLASDTPLAWLLEILGVELDSNMPETATEYVKIHSSQPFEKKSFGETARNRIERLREISDIVDKNPIPAKKPPGLMPVKDIPKFESFSATQLMVYSRDKEEYYRRYFLGFFEGDYDRLLLDPGDADMSLLKGKIIHRYLEAFPDFDLQKALLEFEVADTRLQNELENELKIIESRINTSKVLREILSPAVYKTEVTVHMKLGENYITGTLDRIYYSEQNRWEIVDYKSNRVSKHEVDKITEKYIVQLETYALLLAHLFPEQNVYQIKLYYIHADVVITRTYHPPDILNLREKYSQKIAEIRTLHDKE